MNIPAGAAVDVDSMYGRQVLVLRENISDNPETYRTVKVSLSWDGPIFRTEGRVQRAELR